MTAIGRKVSSELERFGDRIRRGVEPRTGASEAQRETQRVRTETRQAEQQAQQEESQRRRRRESMMRASLQPRENLLTTLGTAQQTDRLG